MSFCLLRNRLHFPSTSTADAFILNPICIHVAMNEYGWFFFDTLFITVVAHAGAKAAAAAAAAAASIFIPLIRKFRWKTFSSFLLALMCIYVNS